MTKAKEHAIGERFEIDRIIYEVRPARSTSKTKTNVLTVTDASDIVAATTARTDET